MRILQKRIPLLSHSRISHINIYTNKQSHNEYIWVCGVINSHYLNGLFGTTGTRTLTPTQFTLLCLVTKSRIRVGSTRYGGKILFTDIMRKMIGLYFKYLLYWIYILKNFLVILSGKTHKILCVFKIFQLCNGSDIIFPLYFFLLRYYFAKLYPYVSVRMCSSTAHTLQTGHILVVLPGSVLSTGKFAHTTLESRVLGRLTVNAYPKRLFRSMLGGNYGELYGLFVAHTIFVRFQSAQI